MISVIDVYERYHDWRLAIRTVREAGPQDKSLDDADCNPYMPCGYYEFAQAMKLVRPTQDDVFLDIGSGLGRALILAAAHPFRRIIGVELSAELNDIASLNLNQAVNGARRKDIELVNANATAYPIPHDVTVIFLYNPFKGPTLEKVLEQVRESHCAAPRRIRILYHNITEATETLSLLPWLTKQKEIRSVRGPGRDCVIYEAKLPGSNFDSTPLS